MRVTAAVLALALGLAFRAALSAATLYVDGTNGNDAQSGLTLASAWRTIQHAAAVVNPGDTVLIQPGVYFEHVLLTRTGTAVQPITFRAAGPGTIVSGANVAIRAGQAVWTLESGAPNLYSTPLPVEPATVLSDDVDLFAYQTLAELQSFTLATTPPVPGPQQGFAFANGKLYVRLNVRYGSLLPSAHVMKVSPPRAGGYRGDVIQQPSDYNWSVQTTAPAYVVIDGFTFESPGYAGVWIHYGNVTVRNGLFLGCRTGVRGWAESENVPSAVSRDVIVQGCEFSQYPAFQDMIDVVAVAESLTPAEQAAIPAFFWWSRKGGPRTSEIGLTTSAGLRWKILGNYIHDTIDGLSFLAIGWSDQCEVAYNHFERLIDNAVEAEQHSQHLRVHHNFVRDVYAPFSYQPDAGPPYPASTWFYRNVVTLTPEVTAFWKKPILKWTPGCIKIKPPTTGFTSIGLEGLIFFNNTLHYPVGTVFDTNSAGTSAGPIKYYNNLVIADVLLTTPASPTFAGTTFFHNIVAPATPGQPGPGAIFAGTGGQTLASPAQMGFEDFASGRFRLAPGSPAIGAGLVVAWLPGTSTDAGAFPSAPQYQRFDEWRFQYFYDDLFDPETSGVPADGDHDGVNNLLECLLTRNPLAPDGVGPTTPSIDASGHLVLSFLRRTPMPEDVTWKVEASGDLLTWASGAGVTETLTPTPSGANLTTEHVRDLTVPGQTPRFLRLQASLLDIPPGPVPESPLVRTLTVGSSNPDSGVSIAVSPDDNSGAGSGTTMLSRIYNLGSVVSLTAPGTAGGNNFQKWRKDGLDFSAAASVSVTMDGDHTLTAVYVADGGGTTGGETAYVTGQALGTVRNNYTGYVGMKIGVGGIPVTVTALGRIFVSGNSGTHLVKLVNAADGSDVAGGSVAVGMSGGTAGQFKYAALSSPVVLAAGGTYYVVSQETFGGDAWCDFNTTVTTTSVATELSSVYGSGGGTWIPYGSAGQTYGPVDFKYSSGAPPVCTLTVSSSNPNSGAAITVSPSDNNGAGSGTTTFMRAYNSGSVVSVTASGTVGGNSFQKWQKDGVDFSAAASVSVTMDGDHTLTAVYGATGGETAYVTGKVLGTVRNNYTGYVGMKIGVGGIPVSVTALGRIFVSGNSGTHLLKLVNAANGSDVAGGSVAVGMSGGTAGQFKYAALSSPVVLAAGGTYYVVSQESAGGDAWCDYNTTVTTTSVATELSSVYSSGGGTWIPYGSAGQTFGPVDFKYSSAQ